MTMSQQIRIGEMKLPIRKWLLRFWTPASPSVREMAEMSDLDLRDLAIGRSQISYFIHASGTEPAIDR
jgi:uncharacterized protein YjiS (DUF1127 family)